MFYEQWHAESSPWTKLQGSLERCPRVSPEAIEAIKKTTAKEVFEQEVECKFVAAGGQVISLKPSASATATTSTYSIPNTTRKERYDPAIPNHA